MKVAGLLTREEIESFWDNIIAAGKEERRRPKVILPCSSENACVIKERFLGNDSLYDYLRRSYFLFIKRLYLLKRKMHIIHIYKSVYKEVDQFNNLRVHKRCKCGKGKRITYFKYGV